uniref:Endonuclease/exonuclease/phosphatase domain-containing protein n=1 Tax=Latimeria chalumnae TaxID=7897 RepID=H2ZY42_LATCH
STTDTQQSIHGFAVVSLLHHRQYGMASYIREDIPATPVSLSGPNDVNEFQAIKLKDLTLINIYKPPSANWPLPVLPTLSGPSIYCGDFNSHHSHWGYPDDDVDGVRLEEWVSTVNLQLLYDPKQPPTFHSNRWSLGSSPDLSFSTTGQHPPVVTEHKVHDKFPRSQHQLCLITMGMQIPITSGLQKPWWNFWKARWDFFQSESDPCGVKVLAAAKKSIPWGFHQQFIPGWSSEVTRLYQEFKSTKNKQDASDKSRDLFHLLDQTRQERWKEMVSKLNFTHSSHKAWQTIKRLSGDPSLSKRECPVTANFIASQLV